MVGGGGFTVARCVLETCQLSPFNGVHIPVSQNLFLHVVRVGNNHTKSKLNQINNN